MSTSQAAVQSAQGRDFSDYQPVQTPAMLRGLAFAIAKATEGTFWTGQTFPANWRNMGALAYGGAFRRLVRKVFRLAPKFGRGAYHFFHPGEDPKLQAQHFWAVLEDAGGVRPGDSLWCDSELMSGVKVTKVPQPVSPRSHLPATGEVALKGGVTAAQVDVATKAFLDELSRLVAAKGLAGRVAIGTYTMHAVGQYLVETSKAYPLLWFAWPASAAPAKAEYLPWPEWVIWQYGGNSTVGDLDGYNGTVAAFLAWLATLTSTRRPVTEYTTDGKLSLLAICGKHNDRPHSVILRSLRHGLHPRLLTYAARHPHFEYPMPAGIRLFLAE